MKLILQPDDSELCGQACVAMAAGVSLKRAISAIGHKGDTSTADVVFGLRSFGLTCADKLVRISRKRPMPSARAMIVIHRPAVEHERRNPKWHWMLSWDGKIYDPGGRWPEGYDKWQITSYLEIR
jgi:hypothetical protein